MTTRAIAILIDMVGFSSYGDANRFAGLIGEGGGLFPGLATENEGYFQPVANSVIRRGKMMAGFRSAIIR
jgi:hypothetical protein